MNPFRLKPLQFSTLQHNDIVSNDIYITNPKESNKFKLTVSYFSAQIKV